MKRFFVLLLAIILATGLAACSQGDMTTSDSESSGNPTGTTRPTSAGTGETQETTTWQIPAMVIYAYPGPEDPSADLWQVQDKVNEITHAKIDASVILMPIAVSAYAERISLMISSGAGLDLFLTPAKGNVAFAMLAAQGMLLDITDLAAVHANGAIDIINGINKGFLDATTYKGRLYGFPTLNDHASALYFALRSDILKTYGLVLDEVEQIADLEKIMAAIQPFETMPILAAEAGSLLVYPSLSLDLDDFSKTAALDTLGDNGFVLGAVLGTDNRAVMNYFESQAYARLVACVHTWFENGYLYENAAAYSGTAAQLIADDAALGMFRYGNLAAVNDLDALCGHKMTIVKIADGRLSGAEIRRHAWVLTKTCNVPDATLAFLNLTYTDPEIINLLDYGLSGQHYVEVAEGRIQLPSGVNPDQVGYHMINKEFFGNPYLAFTWLSDPGSRQAEILLTNQNAATAVLPGFIADTASLQGTLISVNSVLTQYRPILECGRADPDQYLEEFLTSLRLAGYPAILAEMQRQIDDLTE